MRRCKTCLSEFTEEVKRWSLQGYSNTEISKMLSDMGVSISHASISRHLNKCEGITHNTFKKSEGQHTEVNHQKVDVTPTPFVIDRDGVLSQVNDQMNTFDLLKLVKGSFLQMLLNQMSICIAMQEGFMQGECRYPGTELKGLKNIFEIINMMTNAKSKEPLFDFEQIFRVTRYATEYSDPEKFNHDKEVEELSEAIEKTLMASGDKRYRYGVTHDEKLDYLTELEKLGDLLTDSFKGRDKNE